MEMPKEFAGIFRGADLTEDEIRTLNWITGWEHQTVENLRSAVQKAQGAALTPPNEPLTLEQLRKMDGEPVWVTPLGFWALVIAKHDERVKLISNDGEIVYADKEIELVGPVYRRPPEGDS